MTLTVTDVMRNQVKLFPKQVCHPPNPQVMCKAGQPVSDDKRGLVFGLSLAATSLALLLLAAIVGLLMLRRSRRAELQQMRSLPQQR